MVSVLRLGHRAGRDDRISTHVGLAARQWGCDEILYSGQRDKSMMNSVRDIVARWGGEFSVEYLENPRELVDQWDQGPVFHLTMYGENPPNKFSGDFDIDQGSLIIVGSQRVPRHFYDLADYNLGIGNQPHSEIAALSVFLDRYNDIKSDFTGGKIEVVPSKDQKKTREK